MPVDFQGAGRQGGGGGGGGIGGNYATCVSAAVPKKVESKENIEDIYFFEVNTKYISSNVMKISVNSRVRSTSEFSDIFNT